MKSLKLVLIVALIAGFAFAFHSPVVEAQGPNGGPSGLITCAQYAAMFSGDRVVGPGTSFGLNGPFEQAVYHITVTGLGGTTGTVRLVADGAGMHTLAGPSSLPATFTYHMGDPQPPGMGIYVDSASGGEVSGINVSISCGFGACLPYIPPQAVVGQFNWNSEIYWAPGHQVQPMTYVEAGRTYYVAGQDESEEYYKVLIACEWYWVRKDTVGPNYDEVWQGRPLPTKIVE